MKSVGFTDGRRNADWHFAPMGFGGSVPARVGDYVDVMGARGEEIRRGMIVEIFGRPDREHFAVRWHEHHESIVFPGRHVRITPATA